MAEQNTSFEKEMFDAAEKKDNQRILQILELGTSINCVDSTGWSLLHWAVKKHNDYLTTLLIEKGAKLDIQDKDGRTPLHLAIMNRINDQAVVALVEKSAQLDIQDKEGRTPLHSAALNSNHQAFVALVEKCAQLDIQDKKGRTPFHSAALNPNHWAVVVLVEKGAQLDIQDKEGRTPLHFAIMNCIYGEAVMVLVVKGAQLDIQDKEGRTPLHSAVLHSNHRAVVALVEKGAQLDIQDKNGTPLHSAVLHSNHKVVVALMEKGAQLDIQDKNGRTPLHSAALNSNHKAVVALVEKGAQLDIQDKNGRTPLHSAALNSNHKAVVALVEKGAQLDIQDKNGRIPLHLAIMNRINDQAVVALVGKGAQLDIQDKEEKTPLHLAATNWYYYPQTLVKKVVQLDIQDKEVTLLPIAELNANQKVVVALVEKGAQLDIQDKEGRTPLHSAALNSNDQAVVVLMEKGAQLNIQDKERRTPLHFAIMHHINDPAVVALVEKATQLDIQDKEGNTALHLALKEHLWNVAMLLILKGANVNIQNYKGYSPIGYAKGHIIVLLIMKGAIIPAGKTTHIDKIIKFEASLLKQECVLDWSDLELDDSELLDKLNNLPQDFQCSSFHVHSSKLSCIPNLKTFKQFDNLIVFLITSKSVKTLQGLPSNIKFIFCASTIEILAKDCFFDKETYVVLKNTVNLDNLKQPPKEIVIRGRENVLQYYKKGHRVIHSRNRATFMGETTAGKTSLVRSLIEGRPVLTDIADRTRVMDIKEWHISESQIMMMVDQGGHPVYQICNPYFITDNSTILIAHKLSAPSMTYRSKQVFRHILHQHPATRQIHFVLSHNDLLSDEQSQQFYANFQAAIRELITSEIDNMQRLVRSPKGLKNENLIKTLSSFRENLRSIEYFLVSSKSYEGVEVLRNFLKTQIKKQIVAIPEHWIEFYNKINSSGANYYSRKQIGQVISRIKGFNQSAFLFGVKKKDNSDVFSEDVLVCLHYFVDTGLLLWNEQHAILKDYFFHDLNFLIEVFKSLFDHNLKSTLNYDENTKLQDTFGEAELDDAIKQYQENGLLKHKLLSFLWQSYNLNKNDESVLVSLIKMFHIFSEIHSNPGSLSNQLYFVPWLVHMNTAPKNFDIDQPLMFTNESFTLALQCVFHNQLPLNVVEMFCVEVQRYAVENRYLGKRYAWADGLQVKVGPKEIIAFKHHSENSLFILVRSKTKTLGDAWHSFKAMYLSLQSILQSFEGVVRSLHTICSHCILNKIKPAKRWLLDDVFPCEPSNSEYVSCDKDEDSEIPLALVAYPADNQMSSQTDAVKQYLQDCFCPESGNGKETQSSVHVLTKEDLASQLSLLSEQRSHQKILESTDASGLTLHCEHPVLAKTQELLEENLAPNEMIDKLIKFDVINDNSTIFKDKSVGGKVKKILVLVDRSKKIREFIEALNDCNAIGANFTLASMVRDAYNEFLKLQS